MGTTDSSWYANIIFFGGKLELNLDICKNLTKGKFKSLLKKHIRKCFLKQWSSIKDTYSKDQNGKLCSYFKYKNLFEFEKYLLIIKDEKRRNLTKFRLSNHCLRVESGRYERVRNNLGRLIMLPRNERFCLLCNSDLVEDEIHSMFECKSLKELRDNFFMKNIFQLYPNLTFLNYDQLFIWVMSNEDPQFIKQLSQYLLLLYEFRRNFKN